MADKFILHSNYKPTGDQPEAIEKLVEGVNKAGLSATVTVTQTGCIGICQFEPVVEVYEAGKEKVTYVKMTAEKAEKVINEHLKNGKVITEYTLAANK